MCDVDWDTPTVVERDKTLNMQVSHKVSRRSQGLTLDAATDASGSNGQSEGGIDESPRTEALGDDCALAAARGTYDGNDTVILSCCR